MLNEPVGRRLLKFLFSEMIHTQLEINQWKKPREIERLQSKKLSVVLNHAYNNCPYYRKVFKSRELHPHDVRNISDLCKIPILTKQLIKANFKNLVARNYPPSKLIPWSTGGSTGEPLKFLHDEADLLYVSANNLRQLRWMGYCRFFDKTVTLWGFPREKITVTGKLLGLPPRDFDLSIYGASQKDMLHIANMIRTFKPDLLKGYSSYLYLLAKYAEANGIKDIHPRFIQSVSEKLYDCQREKIENIFGCRVFDNYSSREFSIAQECKEHSGYHIASDILVLEFVRDNEQVSPGELGKILVTDLTKFGMPFLRYEIGDMGIPSNETCSCGRGLPLMQSLEGRTTDFVFTPSGRFISGSAVTLIFRDLDVEGYQIVQKTKEKIIVNIIRGSNFSDTDAQFILNSLGKYARDIEVELQFVEKIPPTRSGKNLIIVSSVCPEPNGTIEHGS